MKLTLNMSNSTDPYVFIRYVGDQIDDGFTSGHINSETYWEIEE